MMRITADKIKQTKVPIKLEAPNAIKQIARKMLITIPLNPFPNITAPMYLYGNIPE